MKVVQQQSGQKFKKILKPPNPMSSVSGSAHNIEQFKHQTFTLIKQQSIKIKTCSKELEIKDEQIRLLKETIEVLEQERDQAIKANAGFRVKIDTILKEVAHYNDTVVQKLWDENDSLKKKLQEVGPALDQSLTTITTLTAQIHTLQQSLQTSAGENSSLMGQLQLAQKQVQNWKQQSKNHKQTLEQQSQKLNRLEAEHEQQGNKVQALEKQVDHLFAKCQDTVQSYEKKIRSLKEGMVKKEELIKVEQDGEKAKLKGEEAKREIQRLGREKNQALLLVKVAKEKEITFLRKQQLETTVLEADIRNLKDSCKMGRKAAEFESKYCEYFDSIMSQHQRVRSQSQQLEQKLEYSQNRQDQLEIMVNKKQQLLQQSKSQLEILSHKLASQTQSIESSYQAKILQLSLKIKKQQEALHSLSLQSQQYSQLSQEYQHLCKQHTQMKQTLENTIEQYKKQNKKLGAEVEELILLCDGNIDTKNSINCVKHTINNLIAVVCYLYLMLVRNREARRKIYLPFIMFYFGARQTIEANAKLGSTTKLRKFRSCVVVVIAIKRMERGKGDTHSSGLIRYSQKAILTKSKIQDLSEYLDKLVQKSIQYQKNIPELLKETRNMYKWSNVANYQKFNIAFNSYKQQ